MVKYQMKTLHEFILEREYEFTSSVQIDEMANLGKRTTKLPCVVYVSSKKGVAHGPRIKVNADYSERWCGNSFTITISDNPRVIGNTFKIKQTDIEDITDWVKLNKTCLLEYWNEQIDIAELIDALKYFR